MAPWTLRLERCGGGGVAGCPWSGCGPRATRGWARGCPDRALARGSTALAWGAGPRDVMHMHEQRGSSIVPWERRRRRDGADGGGPWVAGGAQGGLSAWSGVGPGPRRRGAGPGLAEVSGPQAGACGGAAGAAGAGRQVRRLGRAPELACCACVVVPDGWSVRAGDPLT